MLVLLADLEAYYPDADPDCVNTDTGEANINGIVKIFFNIFL